MDGIEPFGRAGDFDGLVPFSGEVVVVGRDGEGAAAIDVAAGDGDGDIGGRVVGAEALFGAGEGEGHLGVVEQGGGAVAEGGGDVDAGLAGGLVQALGIEGEGDFGGNHIVVDQGDLGSIDIQRLRVDVNTRGYG